MPALQVREFPDELYAQLKEFAAQNHRSMAQQTIVCVQNEIERSRVRGEAAGVAADDDMPDVPARVWASIKEASERAQFVRPWERVLEYEPDEVIEARKARRRKALEEAARIEWKGPKPTIEEIVAMIREDRETRGDELIENIERYLAEKEGMPDDGR